MDFQKILDEYSLEDFPVGLTGCRSDGTSHKCCEYDLTVFDERDELDTVIEHGDSLICLRHRSLSSQRSPDMVRYENMKIISDASWDLHMLLGRIREKRNILYTDYMRNLKKCANVVLKNSQTSFKLLYSFIMLEAPVV